MDCFEPQLKTLFIGIGVYIAVYTLNLPVAIMKIFKKCFKIMAICILTKGFVNVVDPKSGISKKLRKDINNESAILAKNQIKYNGMQSLLNKEFSNMKMVMK